MKLAWCTDIHINFLEPRQRQNFYTNIRGQKPDAVLITGDISEGDRIEKHLKEIASGVEVPVYFVLGNHDYYRSDIETVRASVTYIANDTKNLFYLPNTVGSVRGTGEVLQALQVQPLTPSVCLTGVDGWADALLGDYFYSRVVLADDHYIQDLSNKSREMLYHKRAALGKDEAVRAESLILQAFKHFQHVIFATHIPPFKEATWHRGQHSDNEWLPFFSCKQVGDVLIRMATDFPEKKITVYCGHTHGAGVYKPLPNLEVFTGEARYRYPKVQKVIELL